MGRREADPPFVAALASTPRARYRAHTESSPRELAEVEARRVDHLEMFVGNGYLDAGRNYDLGVILDMHYLELGRIYLRMRLGGEHDPDPTLSELRSIVVWALWVTRRLVLPHY